MTRKLIAAFALATFSLRALVPSGFMPAPDRLFSLELCPDGLPRAVVGAGMHHHEGMPRDHDPEKMPGRHPMQIEHCVFGGASAFAVLTHFPALGLLLPTHILPAARFTPQRTGLLLLRVPLPRGPPVFP